MDACQGPCLKHCYEINTFHVILSFIIGCLFTYFVGKKILDSSKSRVYGNTIYKQY